MGHGIYCCRTKIILLSEKSVYIKEPYNKDANSLEEELKYDLTSKNNKNSHFNRENSTQKEKNIPVFNTYKDNITKKLTKECIEGKNLIKKGRIDSFVNNKIKNKRRKSFAISMTGTFKNSSIYQKKLSGFHRNETTLSNKTSYKAYQILPKESKKFFESLVKDAVEIVQRKEKKKSKFMIIPPKSNLCESTRSKSIENKIKEDNTNEVMRKKRKSKSIQVKEKNPMQPIQNIDKQFTQKQKDLLRKLLIENELINEDEMPESLLNTVFNLVYYQRIKDNIIFFTGENTDEDLYYMIYKGSLIYNIDGDFYELNPLNGISTQALLKYSRQKCYIQTLGRTYLFVLPLRQYRKLIDVYEKNRNEEILGFLEKNYFFKNLPKNKISEIAKTSVKRTYNERTTIINEEEIQTSLYYIMSGNVKCAKNDIVIKHLIDDEIFSVLGLFNQMESFYKYSAEPDSILIEIKYDNLFQIFEEKTVEIIIDNMFVNAVKENELFLSGINVCLINKMIPCFQLQYYFNDTILSKKEKKVILPVCGTILKSKKSLKEIDNMLNTVNINYKNRIENGKLNIDSITSDTTINFHLLGDECIVFECDWESLLPKIITNQLFKFYNIQPLDFTKTLKSIPLYHFVNPFKMYQIINSMEEKKFKKGQIILKDGPLSEKFFYILNGEVEITIKNISIKTLTSGKYFGDIGSKTGKNKKKIDFISKKPTTVLIIKKDIFENIVYQDDLFKPLRKIMQINEYNMSFDNFYYIRDLGSGAYGRVYLVHNKKEFFALKTAEIRIISQNKESAANYVNEYAIMSCLEHPFIIHLNSAYKTKDYIFFLIEYVNGINLRTYIEKHNNLRCLENVKFYGGILFCVLHYLNQRKIIHRDLKPENIMMNSKGYFKVIDFGVAKNLMGQDSTNTVVGTPMYMSPEVILGKSYNFKVDYWSVGIILYEIFYGNTPFGNSTRDVSKIYKEILENKPFLTSGVENKFFNSLISLLLCKKPSSRISTFKDIKNHEFFKNYDFDKLLNFTCNAPYTPDEYINKREHEFLKNEFTPLLNFVKNCVYQNSTEIAENMWRQQLDDLLVNF